MSHNETGDWVVFFNYCLLQLLKNYLLWQHLCVFIFYRRRRWWYYTLIVIYLLKYVFLSFRERMLRPIVISISCCFCYNALSGCMCVNIIVCHLNIVQGSAATCPKWMSTSSWGTPPGVLNSDACWAVTPQDHMWKGISPKSHACDALCDKTATSSGLTCNVAY